MAKRPKKEQEATTPDVTKELNSLMNSINKAYGDGIVQIGESVMNQKVERWEIDSPNVSYVLGGGIPKGRIIELYGPESSGKTTLATFMAAQIQQRGGKVAVIDAEHGFDMEYAETLGLKKEEVVFSQPSSGEQALNVTQKMAESGLIDFIVIDSVAALTPEAEIAGEMGDQTMGLQARLMGRALRKLIAVCNETKTTLCFINQIRMKIGVLYGNPETTPGGKALKFYSSVRLEIRKVEWIKEKQEVIGVTSRVKGAKNKVAPPFRKAEINIIFGKGLQYEMEYVDHAITYDIVKKGGAWYSVFDEKGEFIDKFQGKDNLVAYLKENDDVFSLIKEQTKKAIAGKVINEVEEEENEQAFETDEIDSNRLQEDGLQSTD